MKKNILLAITIALSFSLAICKQSNASENTSLKDISLSTIVAANTSAESVNDIKGGYGTIINVTESNFDVVISKGLVLVDFYANWCGPCKKQRPVLEEIAKEKAGKIVIGALDTDKSPNLSKKYNIVSIPCMILFKNGIEIKRIIGYHEKAELLNEIFSSNDSGSNNGGRIITISESNFTSATSKGLVLVDFTASWCGWCKKLHPILEEIAAENSSKLTVAQIDADKNTSVVRKYEIEGYPTMLLFKDGKLVKTIVGYKDKANLLKEIEPYF